MYQYSLGKRKVQWYEKEDAEIKRYKRVDRTTIFSLIMIMCQLVSLLADEVPVRYLFQKLIFI